MKKILFLSLFFLNSYGEDLKSPKEAHIESQKPGPITEGQASAILQVAGGLLHILTNPHNQTNVTNGVGVMATGMANLFFQVLQSRGINTQLSDEELQDLAQEMAQMVNRSVEIEITHRNFWLD